MSSTVEKIASNKVKIDFVVPAEKFDEGIKAAYRKLVKRINIPGFRKGKAPMKVVENFYGEGVFNEDALEAIFPEVYREAIEANELEVVDRPEMTEVTQIGKGQELKFTVEVFVKPEVKLGQYTDLGVEKVFEEVTDADITAEIERARERAARYVEITDRAAKLDDQVNIDYAGFLGEEQFEGGTAKGYDLVLGSGSFIPGFEDQLVGAEVGSDVDVNVTFPEQYHSEDLAGKAVVFHVHVNAIHEKEVPALDDDFVTEVSETANTVDEYKAEIRANLEKKAADKAEAEFENAVMEKVVETAEMDIPQAMIDEQVENMMQEMEMRMAYQGMRLEDYLKYMGQTREQFAEQYKQPAEDRVRMQLTVEAIRKAEGIVATEDEIKASIEQYAEQNKRTYEEFEKMLNDEDKKYFAEIAATQKTIEFLKANA